MSLIIINTKGLYDKFMICDENGVDQFIDNQVATNKMQLSSEKVKFIKNYLTLIMNTNIVSDTTKMYIRCNSDRAIKPSFEAIIRERNKKGIMPPLNLNTCLSKITYDTKKLRQYFPDDMLEKLKNVNTHNISSYQDGLYRAIAKYSPERAICKNLVLKFPMTGINEKLTDSEFADLLKIIEPYTTKYVDQLIKGIPERYLQYFNYLIYVENKEVLDIERFRKLERVLSGEAVCDVIPERAEELVIETAEEVKELVETINEPKPVVKKSQEVMYPTKETEYGKVIHMTI